MDITLPKIEPASPVRSPADNIDAAGAAFKRSMDTVANVIGEDAKMRIAVETQEATVQGTKQLHNIVQTIQTKPYVKSKDVPALFGGQVPSSIDLTEPVPGQPDEKKRQPRAVVPMHELAIPLFEQQAAQAVIDAGRNVTDDPWRRQFERAFARDVEAKRAEVMDWQRAQFLADAEIRSVAQFHQAMSARNYPLAEAILNGPGMGVRQRETLRAEMPAMRTKAVVEDRLRSVQTPQEADKLIADIAGNRVTPDSKILENPDGTFSTESTIAETDPKTGKIVTVATVIDGRRYDREQAWKMYLDGKNPALHEDDTPEEANAYGQARHEYEQRVYGPMRGKFAKLTPEQQYQFAAVAQHRRKELVSEMEAARKMAREVTFQKYGNIAFEALKLSQQYGVPASHFWSISQISGEDNAGMDFGDKMTLLHALEADPKRPTDPAAYLELARVWHTPGALGKLSPQAMWNFLPKLSTQDGQTWMDRWAQDRKEPGAVKSPITSEQDNLAGRYVSVFLQTDPKDKPQEYEIKKGQIVQMMIDNALSPNPKPMFTINDVAAITAGRFDDSRQKATGDVVLRGGLAYLGGAWRVTDQMIADHKKQMKAEAPLVDKAYKALVTDDSPNDEWRARVHVILANPVELQKVKEQLRANPAANPEDKQQQIFQITKNLQMPESLPYAQGVEEDAIKARKLEQVRAEAEKQRAEEKAAKEAQRLEAETKRRSLPVWEQHADEAAEAEVKRRFNEKREQVRQEFGRDPIDQTPFAFRTPPPDFGRADLAAEKFRPGIEQQVAAEYDSHKRAFREFLRMVNENDPVAVELAQKFFLDTSFQSFKKYIDLRKKGEVY